MALIIEFVPSSTERRAPHPTTVTCGWLNFLGPDGPILQLDTYGSDERQIQGKVTQTIQVDEAAARRLIELLEETFPSLRKG
jgi:5-methylcytosine-specific restriction protein B